MEEILKKYNDMFKKAVVVFGVKTQLVVVIEEMAELTKEISKWFRGEDNRDRLLDEYVDVLVMLEQLKNIFQFTDEEIDKHLEYKLSRIQERLNK